MRLNLNVISIDQNPAKKNIAVVRMKGHETTEQGRCEMDMFVCSLDWSDCKFGDAVYVVLNSNARILEDPRIQFSVEAEVVCVSQKESNYRVILSVGGLLARLLVTKWMYAISSTVFVGIGRCETEFGSAYDHSGNTDRLSS